MKWSSQKTIVFQVGILKLCNGHINNEIKDNVDNKDIQELNNRIKAIENKLKESQNVNIIPRRTIRNENKNKQ